MRDVLIHVVNCQKEAFSFDGECIADFSEQVDAAGPLSQLRLAYSLLSDCALGCLQLSADLIPYFAHELLIHYKFYAFLATADRLSHAVRVNASYLNDLLPLCCCFLLLGVAFTLLIVTVGYIPFTTLVFDLVIQRLVGNGSFLLRSIDLLP